jgi:hypothetical protein
LVSAGLIGKSQFHFANLGERGPVVSKASGKIRDVFAARWLASGIFCQRLREGIAAFFDAHLGWLEQALKAGIENGTILQGVDAASSAKLVLSTLRECSC